LFGETEEAREAVYWVLTILLAPFHALIFPFFSWWYCLSLVVAFYEEECINFWEIEPVEVIEVAEPEEEEEEEETTPAVRRLL